MYPNLKAEMARVGLNCNDLARAVGKTPRTMQDKLKGETDFTIPEALAIRSVFFPSLGLEYLFEKKEA